MSQTTDTTLSDQSGASFRTELNSIISALNTDFSGATAPVTPEAYMRWVDTSVSPNVLRRRNSSNTAWELHPTQQLATDAMPKSGGTFSGAYNGKQGADIASAATTNIEAATGNSVNVTGTTTITSLGVPSQAGIKRTVTFTGVLTLTHNASTLILPSAANVKTAAGDVAEFISTATGWRCTNYVRANGLGGVVDGAKGADIASAATTDIGAATGDYVTITGTTTITSLGTVAAGVERNVRFSGALTLTHNATSLILPSAANITTVAGDCARFRSEGAGNWRCVSYTRADGGPLIITAASVNSTGSAPVYGARAWVNFNGTGTIAILGSGNVTSIGDGGVGDYTVNFTTAMPDTGYAAVATAANRGGASSPATNLAIGYGSATSTYAAGTYTTSAVQFRAQSGAGAATDIDKISVIIFR